MSTDKSMLDRLMATPRKELVDDAIYYHDGLIAAGRECNELKAENAKLREEIELVGTAGYLLATKQLKAENQTLRQLAAALADCRNTTCDDCVRWDYPQGGCALDEVLRECGIEVPE